MCEATKTVLGLRQLVGELDDMEADSPTPVANQRPEIHGHYTMGHPVWGGAPTVVGSDSHAAMRMAKNPTSSRNRHLDTRTQFVRDAVDYLQVTPLYTPTDDQPADGLTKAVGADVIRRHLPYYTGTCDCPDMHNIYT